MDEKPKVFISYSHDSEEHCDQVLALSHRLRDEGIDCSIDLYEQAPPEGWPRWMRRQIKEADFVLVVCTETYVRRFNGEEQPGIGHGACFESVLIIQELYNARMLNKKFIPVLFDRREPIPEPLSPYTSYQVNTEYASLYRYLTSQRQVTPPPVGTIRQLSPRKVAVHIADALPQANTAAPSSPAPARAIWRRFWWLATLPALLVSLGLMWMLWRSMMPPELGGDAKKYYEDGLEALRELNAPLARERFESALEFGDFPQVRSAYAEALLQLGESSKALQESEDARRNARNLSKADRLEIEARHAKISSNWISAVHHYEELHQLFPENVGYVVQKAEAQIADQRYIEAIETIEEMQKTSNDPRLALTEAVAAGRLSRYTQQIDAASRALEQARRLGWKPIQAQALRVRALALGELGRNEDARTDLDEAALLTTGQRFQWALAQSAIGELEFQSGNLAAARQPFEKALKSFNDLGAGAHIAITQLNLANVELLQGRLQTAQDGYKAAAKEYADLGNKEGMAQANGNRGVILLQLGQPEAASRLFERAIMHFQASKNRGEEAQYLCNIAWAHLATLEADSARVHFTGCCTVACDISNEQIVANALQGQGELLLYQGDLAGAYEKHERSIEILDRTGDFTGVALNRLARARIEIESGQPAKAILLAEQARSQLHDAGAQEEALADLVIAQAYLPRNPGAARRALERVKTAAPESEVLELRVRYALASAALQEAEGRSTAAYETIKKVRTQTGTHPAFEMETRLALAEMELKRDPGRGRQQLAELKSDAKTRGFWRIEAAAAAGLGEASSRPPGTVRLAAPPPVGSSSCPCSIRP